MRSELSEQQYNTWIRPLQAVEDNGALRLLAPNRFVLDWVNARFLARIHEIIADELDPAANQQQVRLEIGESQTDQTEARASVAPITATDATATATLTRPMTGTVKVAPKRASDIAHNSNLNPESTFDSFVEGKSNQLARAAAFQVASNAGQTYNPLFIQGGVGLGKTHLMHAIGNMIMQRQPDAKVVYLHSERFVQDMVKALQHNAINEFKRYYRSVNALLIDDIQFFAGKERSQEEFFHTFNALLEGQQHIILTCDRYPKEVSGLEERLISRFGWGLTVAIEPPELETS